MGSQKTLWRKYVYLNEMHKFYLFGAGFKEEGAGGSQYAKQPCSQPHPEGQWDYTKPKHCKQAARCSPRNLQRDNFLQGKDVKQLFLNSSSGLQMLWDFCYGGLTLLDKPLTSLYLSLKLTHTNSICNRVCQFDWNQRYSNVKYQIHIYEFQFEELPCIESYRSSTVYQRVSGKRAY